MGIKKGRIHRKSGGISGKRPGSGDEWPKKWRGLGGTIV